MSAGKQQDDAAVVLAQRVLKGVERTVVAAVDESEFSSRVFHFLRLHFNSPGTTIVFLHVSSSADAAQAPSSTDDQPAGTGAPLVNQWVQKAEEMKLAFKTQGVVLAGDPKDKVVVFCDHLKPDSLVIASHELGPLGQLLHNSLAEHYVEKCHCAVVVVKSSTDS